MTDRPKVGLCIFVLNHEGDKVLIGKRIKEQLYGLPGGRLEYGETFEKCAVRELSEETNLKLSEERLSFLCSFNALDKAINFHWVQINYFVQINENEENIIINTEPDKCENWIWMTYEEFSFNKSDLFIPTRQFLEKYAINSFDDIKNLSAN